MPKASKAELEGLEAWVETEVSSAWDFKPFSNLIVTCTPQGSKGQRSHGTNYE